MRWGSIDPGEDLGWALWDDKTLVDAGTEKLTPFCRELHTTLVGGGTLPKPLLPRFAGIELLVVEDWALYPWKLKSMGWDSCRTARGIGALELIAWAAGIQLVLQPAAIKAAAEAGGAAELFLKPLTPNRHANDAIRHGTFYIQTVLANPERNRPCPPT